MSSISQREIGIDTSNFNLALRAALRQDPDVILVGEMRDAETVNIALKAAETGHMVYSTVHTTDASKTINRLIAMFPPEPLTDPAPGRPPERFRWRGRDWRLTHATGPERIAPEWWWTGPACRAPPPAPPANRPRFPAYPR